MLNINFLYQILFGCFHQHIQSERVGKAGNSRGKRNISSYKAVEVQPVEVQPSSISSVLNNKTAFAPGSWQTEKVISCVEYDLNIVLSLSNTNVSIVIWRVAWWFKYQRES